MHKNINQKVFSILAITSLLASSAYAMENDTMENQALDGAPTYEPTQDDLDQALFHTLIKQNETYAVRLLAKGANPMAIMTNPTDARSINRDFFSSLLVSTAHLNKPAITQKLLNVRTHVNVSKDGMTALTTAISYSALETVKFFFRKQHSSYFR